MNWFARQKQRHRCREQTWTPRGEVPGGGGLNWGTGIGIYTLICIKQITNKKLLYKKIIIFKKKTKLKIELPYDPGIPLLGIYPEKTIIQKDTCTPVFIAALFTIARSWKQCKCPTIDEWIKKMWYIYTMEYYSAIKRNATGSFVEIWMDLESVIQGEVSQKEKNKYHILKHICGIQKNGTDQPICRVGIETDIEKRHVDTGARGGWDELGDQV